MNTRTVIANESSPSNHITIGKRYEVVDDDNGHEFYRVLRRDNGTAGSVYRYRFTDETSTNKFAKTNIVILEA